MNTDHIEPSVPYLLQRLNLPSDLLQGNKKRKIDYRKIKCVHGGVPTEYDKKAINNVEQHSHMRKEFFNYDYMGSAEFEYGALPLAYWKFLRSFQKDEGVIQKIQVEDSRNQVETFWLFAPKCTLEIATAFINRMCYEAVANGKYSHTKESLGLDSALFPNQQYTYAGYGRDSWSINRRESNSLPTIGLFDIKNCYYIIWDRQDIAQAFSNLHGFGDVLSITPVKYTVHSGSKTHNQTTKEYYKQILNKEKP